jgi:hypothetical protein
VGMLGRYCKSPNTLHMELVNQVLMYDRWDLFLYIVFIFILGVL